MQVRQVFAFLILGLAVGIAYVQAVDIAELEKMSVEDLTRDFMSNLESELSELHGKELKKAKLNLLKGWSTHPELRRSVNLPVKRFVALLLETALNDLEEKTPRERTQSKARLIAFAKKAQQEETENGASEEAENEDY